MEGSSKDLLHLEHGKSPTSALESALLVCSGIKNSQSQKSGSQSEGKPVTAPIPKSEVLGKAKDFLIVIAEANKRLQEEAKDKSSEDLDIEVLTGNESQYIEMDLMLGVTDLHTPQAVAAAESAISGHQPIINLKDSSDEVTNSDEVSNDSSDEESDVESKKAKSVANTSKPDSDNKNQKSKKRPRILELSAQDQKSFCLTKVLARNG